MLRKGINVKKKFKVGVIGGTGFVGQRFVTLLEDHPWFEVTEIAASSRSQGKTYREATGGRWKLTEDFPEKYGDLVVKNINEIEEIGNNTDFVFCAVDMERDEIRAIEEAYARAEIPVVSNNSAHRWTGDVPMIIPEINSEHARLIDWQKKRLGTKRGFVAVKPNCSIQSYVPAIYPLMSFGPEKVFVATYQAISGASKLFADWPEILDNVIPYIGGEEEKSEQEPLRIWGRIKDGRIENNRDINISAQCYRVPVAEGHMAAVSVSFGKKPSRDEIIGAWEEFVGIPALYKLPSAPEKFIKYFNEEDRPQTGLDRDYEKGMGITVGRLRQDPILDYKFVCLSHNTLRGAAGGAVLTGELLVREGYISYR